jgi:hypothetical protein
MLINVVVFLPNGKEAAIVAKEVTVSMEGHLQFIDHNGATKTYRGLPYCVFEYPTNQQTMFGEK